MPSVERLSGWDYATWKSASEDPIMRSTMVGIMVLEKSPDWDRLVERYDRASRTVTILRKKIIEGPVGIANPRLVIDPNFDLTFHMRRFRMTEGATWQDVLDEAARQSMTDFDRERPLWKVTLLEGGPGGRAVLISKLHHAIADGQGALALGAALVDIDEKGFDLGAMPEAPDSTSLSARDFAQIMVQDNTEWVIKTAADLLKGAVPNLISALATPQEALEKLSDTIGSFARLLNTPTAPLSPIMNKRSVNYHFANFGVRFRDLRDAAKAEGHTINDAFLAAVSLGLSNYHHELGHPVDELHINMPISTRRPGKDAQNAVTIVRFELPTDERDPNKLMTALGATVRRLRLEPALEYTNQLGEISRFIPKELLTTAAQASDVTASNVPGPPIPIYLAGAKVESIIPMPPPIGAAVFVALLTYNGVAQIGCALDDAAITDRELFMRCLRDGFAEVIGKPVSADDPFTGLKASAEIVSQEVSPPARQVAPKTRARSKKAVETATATAVTARKAMDAAVDSAKEAVATAASAEGRRAAAQNAVMSAKDVMTAATDAVATAATTPVSTPVHPAAKSAPSKAPAAKRGPAAKKAAPTATNSASAPAAKKAPAKRSSAKKAPAARKAPAAKKPAAAQKAPARKAQEAAIPTTPDATKLIAEEGSLDDAVAHVDG